MYTPPSHALLDSLIDKKGAIRNDAELARELGIGAPILSKVRNGRPVGASLRLRIMRRFKVTLAVVDKLAPPENNDAGA